MKSNLEEKIVLISMSIIFLICLILMIFIVFLEDGDITNNRIMVYIFYGLSFINGLILALFVNFKKND